MNTDMINLIYSISVKLLELKTNLSVSEAVSEAMGTFNIDQMSEQDVFNNTVNSLNVFLNTKQNNAHVLDDQKITPWLHTVYSNKYYSERYYSYLQSEERLPARVVDVMKRTNEDILERLGNPSIDMPFKRQGLVVGNVQSGKTANYLSLINLAADYDYKLIILITGIHNNLRSQTQKRVNKGFIGVNSEEQKLTGVGVTNNPVLDKEIKVKQPHCLTSLTEDFSGKIRKTTAVRLENAKNPVIMVIKKNYHTLGNVIKWLRNNEQGQRFINEPVLIIDDEADNASINTSKHPNETTRINGQIREPFPNSV